MNTLFFSMLITSAIGTAFAFMLAAARKFTQKHFSAGWHYYMWLAVLVIMLLPIRISYSFPQQTSQQQSDVPYTEITQTQIPQVGRLGKITENEPTAENTSNTIQSKEAYFPFEAVGFIWFGVFAILMCIKILNYIKFVMRIRKFPVAADIPCRRFTNKKVLVRICEDAPSPMITGLFRHTLLVPETEYSEAALNNILMHEMTHLNRYDLWYKWLVITAKCVHWFNPAIYFIAKKINDDCEASCDMAVVKNMDFNGKKSYMNTILDLVAAQKAIPYTTCMTGNGKNLKKRLSVIKSGKMPGRKTVIISAAAALLIFILGLTASGFINGAFSDAFLSDITADKRTDNRFNTLIIGTDNSGRADTVLVLSTDGKSLTGLFLPRDIKYGESGKMSDIIILPDGAQKAVDTVKQALDIPITYYAKIDIEAVKNIIDLTGGLVYNVPMDMSYSDPHQQLNISLKAGKQVLDGDKAVQCLMYRSGNDGTGYADGDFSRVMVASEIAKEFVVQKIIPKNSTNVESIIQVLKGIETNYPVSSLKKDIQRIKEIDRSSIMFDIISTTAVVGNDGTYNLLADTANSAKTLSVMKFEKQQSDIASYITYNSKSLGLTLYLPEYWKTKYLVLDDSEGITFVHKRIYEKYGEGTGKLFSIEKSSKNKKDGESYSSVPHSIINADNASYVWQTPSDVQCPIWSGSDKEDETLTEEYLEMCADFEFIKNNIKALKVIEGSFVLPTDYNVVSQKFGTRVHPVTNQLTAHNGTDFAVPEGSNVYTIADGTITEIGYDNELGNFIVIESENNIAVKYASLTDETVHKNDRVKQGDIIGHAGNTGSSTGAHLHIEITADEVNVDPEAVLFGY